jgi:uncharacterized protein
MRRLARTRIISESDKRLMHEVKDAVTRLVPDAEVVLYGSTARGRRQPDSDYDVLVLTGRKLTFEERSALHGAVYDIELEREVVLSLAIYSQEQWESSLLKGSPYRRNIMREGVIL